MLLCAALGWVIFGEGEDDQIGYHLRRLEQASQAVAPPRTAKEALEWKKLRLSVWNRIDPVSHPPSEMEEQRQKLVELGYFAKGSFPLASSNLAGQVYAAVMAAPLKEINWSYSIHSGTNLVVITAPGDLPVWGAVVSNLNAAVGVERGRGMTNLKAGMSTE